MKIVQLVFAALLIGIIPIYSVSQTTPDSLSKPDSSGLMPDSSITKTYYDWNALTEDTDDGLRVFRETLKEKGLLRGVSDFLWQNSDYSVYSRGSFGSAWYGSLTGLNPRYLTVYMQGRPMRNARKGKYDLSMVHEYNLTDAQHGSAADLSRIGESSIGSVNFFIKPEFRKVNTSEFNIKRGRGDFDDVNVVLTRRLSNKSSLLIQGLIRDQMELNSLSDLKYKGRKIFGSYERRSDNGWLTSYSLGHTFRRILLSGPAESAYGYETGGSLREVAFDHTLTHKTADDRSEFTAYLSTIESKRFDPKRFNLNNSDTFEDRSLSFYYGAYLKQRLFKLGSGGFYAGVRSELHNVSKTDVDGYELRNLQRSYAFLSQTIGEGGFLSLLLNEGLSSDSQFGPDVVYSGRLNLNFSEQTKLTGEISKSVVDVPLDYQFLNTVNFSLNNSLKREVLSTLKTDFVHTGEIIQFRAGYQSTEIRNPMMVTIANFTDDLDLEITVINDYTLPSLSGELGLNLLNGIKVGLSTWQNLDYDPNLPFARKNKSVAYGSWNRKFFENNLDFTLHGEWIFLGEGNRFTYDPALDFFIITGGAPLPTVSLLNYWFTAEIKDFTLFLRNDNLLQTEYELIEGYEFFGNDFFWGVKWEFIN
ncbi:MAG: hypothetical protein IIA58_00870 [Candidatus Marinimicrobia bacterium]|nr:hypothetical protein [Candidatus Neomarinimicrobiota bacterium]